MTRADWAVPLGSLLAVAAPGLILHYSADPERLAAGLGAPPFAWPRLMGAHLATALPVAWLLAGRAGRLPAAAWALVGLLAAGAAAGAGPVLADLVVGLDLGWVPALCMRSTLAAGLVLPWCAGARALAGERLGRPGHPSLLLGLAALASLVPCGLYAGSMARSEGARVGELVARERPVRAGALLEGVLEVGGDWPIAGKRPRELAAGLAKSVAELRRRAARDLPAEATRDARIERAVLFIRLERLGDAAALLERIEPCDTLVTLLLATVYRDSGRLAESAGLFGAALDDCLPRAESDPAARSGAVTALDGLLYIYREERRPKEAEALLARGLEALPADAAYLHFQLGRHCADAGRPGEALGHLRRAAELDPKRYGAEVGPAVGQLRTHTPGCLLKVGG